MKGAVVMMVHAFLGLAASEKKPAGDVILALLSDEEDGEVSGAIPSGGASITVRWGEVLHRGVRGFPLTLGGIRFYPIQVAERLSIRFELTIRAEGGHGSLPRRGGAMGQLGKIHGSGSETNAGSRSTGNGPDDQEPDRAHHRGNSTGATKPPQSAKRRSRIPAAAGPTRSVGTGIPQHREPHHRPRWRQTQCHSGRSVCHPGWSDAAREFARRDGAELRRIVGPDVEIESTVDGKVGPPQPNLDCALWPP